MVYSALCLEPCLPNPTLCHSPLYSLFSRDFFRNPVYLLCAGSVKGNKRVDKKKTLSSQNLHPMEADNKEKTDGNLQ